MELVLYGSGDKKYAVTMGNEQHGRGPSAAEFSMSFEG